MLVRNGHIILLAQHPAEHPPRAGKFLAGRGIEILGAHGAQNGKSECALKMPALGAGPHVAQSARAVLLDHFLRFPGDFINGLVPGDGLKPIAHAF